MTKGPPFDVPGGGRFATTRWSLVLTAGRGDSTGSARALAELCADYWTPLYAYARRCGHNTEDARDLTQAFFAKLLEKQDLRVADPRRGRFRTFLLSSMQNFLAGEWRRQARLKRGGGHDVLSLDFDSAEASYALEPSDGQSPESVYERRWALGVLDRALSDLREQYREAGNLELFDTFKGMVGDGDKLPFAELAARWGRSEGSLRTASTRFRQRWRQRVRELVAETVDGPDEVRDELQHLLASVSAPR